jgi:hypothetical protein
MAISTRTCPDRVVTQPFVSFCWPDTKHVPLSYRANAEKAGAVEPPKGMFDTANLSDQEVIQLAGLRVEHLPSQFALDEPAAAEFADYCLQTGIDQRTMNALADWYAGIVCETVGRDDVDLDALAARFNEEWEGQLDERHRANLSAWMLKLLTEGGRVMAVEAEALDAVARARAAVENSGVSAAA